MYRSRFSSTITLQRAVALIFVGLSGGAPSWASATDDAATSTPPLPLAETIRVEPLSEPDAPPPVQPLDTITVTAQKRVQNAQDVPVSVQAFDQQSLNDVGATTQFGLQQAVPGLDVNSVAQYTTIYLRGVGSDAFLMADPSVATYVDGIYFPFAQSQDQDFGVVERVEVLKGPQGTLFGRNAVGGAINITTLSPDFDAAETSLQLIVGNRNHVGFRLHQSLPITDWLAVSIAGYQNRSDNYMRGIANGRPLEDELSRGGRIKLRLAPLDGLDVQLVAARQLQEGSGSTFQLNPDPSLLFQCVGGIQTPLCISPQEGFEGELSESTFLDYATNIYYGNATYETRAFDIKLLGSYQEAESSFGYDFDGSATRLAAFNQDRNFAEVRSAEVQLLSNDLTWGASRFEWIAGAYYFDSEQGFDPAALQAGGLNLSGLREGGISLPPAIIEVLDQLDVAFPNGDIGFRAIIGTRSLAGFFQGTLTVTDWLSLTLGGRYQDEERIIIRSESGLLNGDGSLTTLFDWREIGPRDADGNVVPNRNTTTSFSPKATLELRPLDNLLLYATYQEALKSATYNTVALYLPPAFVEPEEIEAIEIGFKTDLFGDVVQFNLAAFEYDITNLQVQFISLLQGGAVSFGNAAAATIRGVDGEFRLRVLPRRLDRLTLTVRGTYLDGKYDEYTDASGFNENNGLFSSNNDYTGNRTVRTPKITATASLSKTWAIPGGDLEIGGDVYRNDGFDYAASNDARFAQPAYTLYGARIGYFYAPWGLSVGLFGRNLTDEQHTQGLIATDFGPNFTLAPPRTYGLRVNLDF